MRDHEESTAEIYTTVEINGGDEDDRRGLFTVFLLFLSSVEAWTGEIHGKVVCDVCGDSSFGPEDIPLED
ncbi:hypothetical protein QJS10_CPB21g00913 [Acorus calamus]|uniref:Uncharacterized protein n=1 Tax=Acorus calamus TaxID=4465 RepID=A0AAV9C2T6_ACOCL|nr:hypothetical protein QJS10_CPB21g00913 [Acorus calamus]